MDSKFHPVDVCTIPQYANEIIVEVRIFTSYRYHQDCVSCPVDPCVCFMTNYQFFCKLCSSTGQESFTKKQASFGQMCFTAIANLMAQDGCDATGKLYSKDKEIIP
jgi:Set1/Ash2 histone methyltransferase complex subunit ASH2